MLNHTPARYFITVLATSCSHNPSTSLRDHGLASEVVHLGSEITGVNREQLGSCGSCGAVGPQRSLYELRVRMRGKTRG